MARHLDSRLKSPFSASDAGIVEHQRGRLHEVLRHAARTLGHRERLFRAGVCDSAGLLTNGWLQAFARVEPIHRFEIRQNPGRFLASAGDVEYRGSTSGTHSEVFVYFAGHVWNTLRQKQRDMYLSWWGITQDVPIVNAVSRLMPARVQDVAIGGVLDLDRILRSLDRFADAKFALRGYPSRLSELAAVWLSLPSGVRKPRPVAVICTGELLYSQQRDLLERAFTAPVVNEYGCHETGISGFTCPEKNRLHLDDTRCLFEVRGEELVTTDLYNCTLPAVRYLSGDLVALERACTCGRPGITARVLGRAEHRVLIRRERTPAGAVDLENDSGISTYAGARDEKGNVIIHAVSAPHEPKPVDLAHAAAYWAERKFGEPIHVSFHAVAPTEAPQPPPAPPAHSWVQALLDDEWGEAFGQLLPPEPLQDIALLHGNILTPHELLQHRGMALEDCARLEGLLSEDPKGNANEQLLAARLLVWASAHRPYTDVRACQALSMRALERLVSAVTKAHADNVSVVAAVADLEIVRWLHLPAYMSASNHVSARAETYHLDALNAHHLLAALEQAWIFTAGAKQSLARSRLRPLLPILIADAEFFAPDFGPWLLSVFRAMLREGNGEEAPHPPAQNAFAVAWWRFRLRLAAGEASVADWEVLQSVCTNERETARCKLEAAYLALLHGELGEPAPWIDVFHSSAEALSGSAAQGGELDVLPWVPLLRALAPALYDAGKPELAYQCLVLSTSPSSRMSAFNRLTSVSNTKQLILYDIAT